MNGVATNVLLRLLLRDDEDFARHVGYIGYNPVKDGLVTHPFDWW